MIVKANSLYIPLKDESVHCVVTSPPYYGLRRYKIPETIWDGDLRCNHQWSKIIVPAANSIIHNDGMSGETLSGQSATRRPQRSYFCEKCNAWCGQLGGEPTIGLYVSHLVQIFREIRRVLRKDGVCWVNLGDSYASGKDSCFNPGGGDSSFGKYLKAAGVHYLERSNLSDLKKQGLKPKDLCEIPSEVVKALRSDGWWLRSRISWIKHNSIPESTKDRPVNSVEYIFLLTKSKNCFYDAEATKIPSSPNTHIRYGHKRDGIPGVHPKSAEPESGVRSNSSFESAVKDIVDSRYRRNSDWFFESWQGLLTDDQGEPLALIVNPVAYKGAHFSTYPPKMIEPLIKCGTSERGGCPKCGSPWKRVITKTGFVQSGGKRQKVTPGLSKDQLTVAADHQTTKTLGWRPSCKCYGVEIIENQPSMPDLNKKKEMLEWAEEILIWWRRWETLKLIYDDLEAVPCLVLDPFAGSGTTLQVALELGRKPIGLDLAYQDLQRKRISKIQVKLPMVE